VGKPPAWVTENCRLLLLNRRVTIYLPEELLDGMPEFQEKQEFHLHLEGAGCFVLKVAQSPASP